MQFPAVSLALTRHTDSLDELVPCPDRLDESFLPPGRYTDSLYSAVVDLGALGKKLINRDQPRTHCGLELQQELSPFLKRGRKLGKPIQNLIGTEVAEIAFRVVPRRLPSLCLPFRFATTSSHPIRSDIRQYAGESVAPKDTCPVRKLGSGDSLGL
jgi:hypothetical protein